MYVVSRIEARSEIYEVEMTLDVNTEIYRMDEGKDYYVVLGAGHEQAGKDWIR